MTESVLASSLWTTSFLATMLDAAVTAVLGAASACRAGEQRTNLALLSDAATWERLPVAKTGNGQPLPSWARMLAGELPRSTAAFL